MPLSVPKENMPKNVIRALLAVTIWCKENGYTVKIFKKPTSKK